MTQARLRETLPDRIRSRAVTRPPGGPHIVALGGGTGLPVVLRGLKAALFPPGGGPGRDPHRERLTGIVTVADDGGSSGRLRRAFGVLAPGDVRNCLMALSGGDPMLETLFGFRFNGGAEQGLSGHSLGNLILTALGQIEGNFTQAVERAARILSIRGQVFPATLDDVTLIAEFRDGTRVVGESQIASTRRPIVRVRLWPCGARALPAAREAILRADLVVLGPGSLFTSLIPVLLVEGVAEALAASRARVALVLNLMTEPGETDGFTAACVLAALRRHAPGVTVHHVIHCTAPIPDDRRRRYADGGATPIPVDERALRSFHCETVGRDLLAPGPLARHDPDKLAHALLELAGGGAP